MGETTHQQAVVRHPMNELNCVFTTDSELESQGNNSMSRETASQGIFSLTN